MVSREGLDIIRSCDEWCWVTDGVMTESRIAWGKCSNLLMSSSRGIIVTGSISVLLTSCCDAAPKTVEDEEAQL